MSSPDLVQQPLAVAKDIPPLRTCCVPGEGAVEVGMEANTGPGLTELAVQLAQERLTQGSIPTPQPAGLKAREPGGSSPVLGLIWILPLGNYAAVDDLSNLHVSPGMTGPGPPS